MRLAIDTSGVDQAMVVLDGRRVLAAEDWVRRRDDQPVLARLEALVERAGGRPDDLDAVVAARGPGSFTGLRVGLALAAGLAYARHVPLYLVDSLPILARRANGDPATVALRDAGRAEVFAWREGETVRRMPAAELVSWLPNSARVITEPAGMLATWSPTQAQLEIPQADSRRLSAALADSAIWTFESQKPLRYDEVQALYVQPAAAEERTRKAP
ncbi:MAG TPA: tRNA (adenosine(37)-N6)-threonylcarbamoyltransferase complex dimerization subunit type 1 TsaB [Candidatus Dormibacteraeota bacterium]|nr:tRNA (adenosine(37)-N6)-threonylcarbamoyltransferase complex dimerization subunit type 1 TsaB [Candidatus Dormibacteraeota bacterium]